MASVSDFRKLKSFQLKAVDKAGKKIGSTSYWKLYAIENIFRVIIHSVLAVQMNMNWWTIAADIYIQGRAQRFKNNYLSRPWHTFPGTHDIYFVNLSDLGEILRANSHLFDPVVPDVDQWIVKIATIKLPRNVIAHMNFPNKNDCARIDLLYDDANMLVTYLEKNNFILRVP